MPILFTTNANEASPRFELATTLMLILCLAVPSAEVAREWATTFDGPNSNHGASRNVSVMDRVDTFRGFSGVLLFPEFHSIQSQYPTLHVISFLLTNVLLF